MQRREGITKTEKTGTNSSLTKLRDCDDCKARGILITPGGEVLWKFFRKLREIGAL